MDGGGRLALLPLEGEEARRFLAAVPEEERLLRWWVILRDGTAVAGDNGGGVALLAVFDRTRPLSQAIRALRLSSFVDWLDKGLSRSRKHLSHCVPDGPVTRRFP